MNQTHEHDSKQAYKQTAVSFPFMKILHWHFGQQKQVSFL